MTDQEKRIRDAVALETWWDPNRLVLKAQTWAGAWRPKAPAMRPRQWELLPQQGAKAITLRQYLDALREFLHGSAGQPEHPGAVERDWEKTGWGTPGLADGLIEVIEDAAGPDNSDRAQGFQNLVAGLPINVRDALDDQNRLRQAREFVATLVKAIRVSPQDMEEQA